MTFYDDMQSVASDVLKEFKQGVIKHIKITSGNGPVDDPGEPVEAEFTLDATARGVKFKYVQNGFAVASDLQITSSLIAKDESNTDVILNPEMKDFISVDGERFKIVKILPKPAAGTIAAFVFIVRK